MIIVDFQKSSHAIQLQTLSEVDKTPIQLVDAQRQNDFLFKLPAGYLETPKQPLAKDQ